MGCEARQDLEVIGTSMDVVGVDGRYFFQFEINAMQVEPSKDCKSGSLKVRLIYHLSSFQATWNHSQRRLKTSKTQDSVFTSLEL